MLIVGIFCPRFLFTTGHNNVSGISGKGLVEKFNETKTVNIQRYNLYKYYKNYMLSNISNCRNADEIHLKCSTGSS